MAPFSRVKDQQGPNFQLPYSEGQSNEEVVFMVLLKVHHMLNVWMCLHECVPSLPAHTL